MKTFISAADIEELAAQGIRELAVGDDIVLTAVARETASQRGVKLVSPDSPAFSAKPGLSAAEKTAPPPTAVSGKPRGCQHGPLNGAASPAGARANGSSGAGPVIDELIGAVKQMAGK